ncbi:MAG: hypothetical protein ABS59_11100 [Methylobacterium sp. SCN 67-24]|nr:MAG: hypothetical protein ABS59_11100 [Methylobacterium sp. SCN 67-24]
MGLKPYLLRLHRWITLVFGLPLLGIIVSGLVLSLEPLAQRQAPAAPLTEARLLGFLDRYDPDGKATGLSVRTYDQLVRLSGVGEDGTVDVGLASGEEVETEGLAEWFGWARGLHERLLLDLGWLVTASTVAMIALAVLGVAMGWPRLRNTLGGWHAGMAWLTLPLAVLSPLTGLFIVMGVGTGGAPAGPRGERVPIRAVVSAVARDHDLAGLTSLRMRGGRLVARIYEGNRLSTYVVTREGLQPAPTNWSRALHEGNWHALLGTTFNTLLSLVLIGLWGTGLVIWARRRFRKRRPRALQSARAAASG